MKTKLFTLVAALALTLTGCKNQNANVGPALLRLGVSTSAGYAMLDNPETVPAVRASTEIICSVAHGTNPSPAAIVEAVNAYGGNSQESLLILSAAIGAYNIIYNGLADTNATATSPYALAVCDGLRDALLFQGEPRWKRNLPAIKNGQWPQLDYTKAKASATKGAPAFRTRPPVPARPSVNLEQMRRDEDERKRLRQKIAQ